MLSDASVPKRLALLGLLVPLLTACTLTPDYEAPPTVSTVADLTAFPSGGTGQTADDAYADWWVALGGARLGTLVDELVKGSLQLQSEDAAVAEALARLEQARGARLPQVSASGEASYARSEQLFVGGFDWDDLYGIGASASWEADLFGGLRAQERAAALGYRASELTYEAVEQQLIAEVARAFVSAIALQRRIELTEEIAGIFRQSESVTYERYKAGSRTVGASDVLITRENLAAAEADIPALQAQLDVQYNLIDLLLGRLPGTTRKTFDTAWRVPDLTPVPLGTPAQLLARRPDVAAQELAYRAALEDVGAAKAQLMPALRLTARLTFTGSDGAELFDWDRYIADLVAALTAPIFQGGQLRAQVRGAEAAARGLAAAYADAALTAVTEVENALATEAGRARQIERLEANVEIAERSYRLADTQYSAGLTNLLTVLETQRSLFLAQLNLILAHQARLNARIDLYLALGGDWRAAPGPSVAGRTTDGGSS